MPKEEKGKGGSNPEKPLKPGLPQHGSRQGVASSELPSHVRQVKTSGSPLQDQTPAEEHALNCRAERASIGKYGQASGELHLPEAMAASQHRPLEASQGPRRLDWLFPGLRRRRPTRLSPFQSSQAVHRESGAGAGGPIRPGRLARQLHHVTLSHRLRPGQATDEFLCFDAAISSCCHCSEWRHALQLMEDMREDGLAPDKMIWDKLLQAIVLSGELASAMALYREADGLLGAVSGELDLHGMSVELAKIAVRVALLDVAVAWRTSDGIPEPARKRLGLTSEGSLMLVVGLGRQSKTGEAVLGPAVWQMLSQELGLRSHQDPRNEGCLIIPRQELRSLAAGAHATDQDSKDGRHVAAPGNTRLNSIQVRFRQ